MENKSNLEFRILIADDDEIVLNLYKKGLNQDETFLSYDLTLCRQGEEAVETVKSAIAESKPFSVAFLDVRMPPGKDGVWAAEQIRKIDPYIEIVFVTGYSDINPEKIYQRVPPVHKVLYMQKPFHLLEISQFATTLSMKWKMEHELRQTQTGLEKKLTERTREISIINEKLKKDIDYRKHTEHKLRESREKLELALDSSNSGIWEWDFKKQLFYMDDRILKILGYKRNEIPKGLKGQEYLHHPEDFPDVLKKINSHAHGEISSFEDEYRVRAKDGQYRWLRSCGKISKWDKEKNPETISGTAVDVTEEVEDRKEKELLKNSLHQAQKMQAIGTLAGGIAHDFNNILSGIFGYAQLAEINIDNPEKAKKDLEKIIQGAQRATELIQQILTFSRQTEHEKHSVKLYLIIAEALKLIRSTIPTTIEIRTNYNSNAEALADPIRIHQVIMNLCTNAYHAMRVSGGILTVELDEIDIPDQDQTPDFDIPDGRYIILKVNDTGKGMDQQTLEKIFDPYFTTKEIGEGTGLGLSLVYGIVEDHGGYIRVYSDPGKGSAFNIFFPITDKNKLSADKKSDSGPLAKGTETIMIVDDEDAILTSTQELLEDYGYKASAFSNGSYAFDEFKKNPSQFDLIITDMSMPQMTGDTLATKVLKIRNDMPIIMCTGYSESFTIDQALKLGIKRYIQKPIDSQRLLLLIREVLDGK